MAGAEGCPDPARAPRGEVHTEDYLPKFPFRDPLLILGVK